jgi:hypothetical protein
LVNVPDYWLWYVGYGSNLLRERFLHYVRGGWHAGRGKRHPGCRDATLPAADGPLRIPGALYFAPIPGGGWSGGGAAFLAPEADGVVLARRYLITAEQFADVLLQENGEDPRAPRTALDLVALGPTGGVVPFRGGPYSRVVRLADVEGRPALTFTSVEDRRAEAVPPGETYVGTIARGLRETYPNLDADGIVPYLAACAGIAGRIETARLRAWVEAAAGDL